MLWIGIFSGKLIPPITSINASAAWTIACYVRAKFRLGRPVTFILGLSTLTEVTLSLLDNNTVNYFCNWQNDVSIMFVCTTPIELKLRSSTLARLN